MTGGRVVVLGRTGRNFAAGMSGGVAYVLDEEGDFSQRCNLEMVVLEEVDDEDVRYVFELVERHRAVTGSPVADRLIGRWDGLGPARPSHADRVQEGARRAARGAAGGGGLMGKATGFLELTRVTPSRRPVQDRVRDWEEVYQPFPVESLRGQASRCMDCGIPFCHQGCPLGNLIPGLERPGLPRPLARGGGAAARHQQLPRVHRSTLPGPV